MSKWIHISYSWDDEESPVKVPDEWDAWDYAKWLAVKEAAIDFKEHEEYGEIGLSFYEDEGRIVLRYATYRGPGISDYCYYQISDSEELPNLDNDDVWPDDEKFAELRSLFD